MLRTLQSNAIDMIYTDPPFGTQSVQKLSSKRGGDVISSLSYADVHGDYLKFLREHFAEFHRVLKLTGTLYVHLDYRWVHYAKCILDEIFGRECFLNEIIWAYDFGGRGKKCWPKKHDNILVYSRSRDEHVFNWNDIDRIPYAAPELQRVGRSEEDAAKRIAEGKVPTDVWWMSIVGTQARERTGWPNQKPVKLVKRVIVASSPKGGIILDPFAGSGTTGQAALESSRQFILADDSDDALRIMCERFKDCDVQWHT